MQQQKIVLCIGFVYPEPSSSAAGARILQLLKMLIDADYKIIFGTTASLSAHSFDLNTLGIEVKSLKLNDSSFDEYIFRLNPSVVLFDRFMTEEQFGWRVAKCCPDALRVLDTEDLHFLRKARGENLDIKASFSKTFLKSDVAKREIASIYRSDLSLIISEVEFNILTKELGIDASLLFYIPFILDPTEIQNPKDLLDFETRKNFVFLGNFMHPPNVQAVQYLKQKIWPELSQKLPKAQLHIYGAYAKPKHLALEDQKKNFYVSGRAEDLDSLLSSYRLLLAPLEFGAGLKGKVLDAMRNGTPCGLSSIAAEGLFGRLPSNGFIEDDLESFVFKSFQLYNEKDPWETAQNDGFNVLLKRFSRSEFESLFLAKIDQLFKQLDNHRLKNITGLLLQHHSLQSTKYLSKWIEAKNKGS
ncbi:MAG: glycosyltransferase [Flavobacteriaceae bacterium]|nr:glycosyltransferase [Flavobacteriaceae bacterium]